MPLGTVTEFYLVDPAARARRAWTAAATMFVGATLVALGFGPGWSWAVCLALASGIVALLATPTVDEEGDARPRRPVVVVTSTSILVRDGRRLRTWTFEELAGAEVSLYANRIDLILVARDGARSFIDCRTLEGGARLPDAVAAHVPLTRL